MENLTWTPDQQRTTPQKSGALRSIRGTPSRRQGKQNCGV
jgi:hypothetical protein